MSTAEREMLRRVGSEIRVLFGPGDNLDALLDGWGRDFFRRELDELGLGYIAQMNYYPEEQMIGLECVRIGGAG